MAYARFSEESDVYVFLNVGGYLECCWCALAADGEEFPRFLTTAAMIDHLAEHVRAGHDVPDYCVGRLVAECEDIDRRIADQSHS